MANSLLVFFFVLHEDMAGMWIVDSMFSVPRGEAKIGKIVLACLLLLLMFVYLLFSVPQWWLHRGETRIGKLLLVVDFFSRLFLLLYEDDTGMWIPCSGWWLPRGEARIGKTPQGERASCNISNKLPRKISSGLRLDGNNQQILQDIVQIEIKRSSNEKSLQNSCLKIVDGK